MLGVMLAALTLLFLAAVAVAAELHLDRVVGRSWLCTIEEYERDYHRCGVCWFYRMGVSHGHAKPDDPIEHWCWEKGRYVE